jgi:hypothetical protein
MAVLHHGAKIDLGGPAINLAHKDQRDSGGPFKVALGTPTSCAPKNGANITGGAACYGFDYDTPTSKGHNGFPGYPVPTKRS